MAEATKKSAKRTRKPGVSVDKFWSTLVENTDKSNAEIAKILGMDLEGFNSRKSLTVRMVENASAEYEVEGVKYVGEILAKRLKVNVGILNNAAKFEAATGKAIKIVTPGFRLEGSGDGQRKSRNDWTKLADMARSKGMSVGVPKE
jgi:hypothetical protein